MKEHQDDVGRPSERVNPTVRFAVGRRVTMGMIVPGVLVPRAVVRVGRPAPIASS